MKNFVSKIVQNTLFSEYLSNECFCEYKIQGYKMSEITMKNRRTGETIKISLQQFKIRFQKELQQALLTYSSHKRQKDMLKQWFLWKPAKDYKSDFYFDLRWNFNNYAISEWYIERIVY